MRERMIVSGSLGVAGALVAVALNLIRRDPWTAITAGLSTGIVAWLFDWYTEQRGQ